ncbi:MAG: Glutamate racemase [Acidobacteria bacterium]|nr:Glutamate racemase [Acidobacteriota bacterium]
MAAGHEPDFRQKRDLHLVVTDSGLGGLSVCAEVERNLRRAGRGGNIRLTYFNASPDRQRGYNDMPGMASRARMFDRALESMGRFQPDVILIACNTLSIVYRLTEFSGKSEIPVHGIIEAGLDLCHESLCADPGGSLVILGTRTTIESGVHRDGLVQKGVEPRRIAAVSCHGLAAATEVDPDGPVVAGLIERCAAEAGNAGLPGEILYAGLCCTHYTYVSGYIREALERHTGMTVRILDPNVSLADSVAAGMQSAQAGPAGGATTVEVVSKVELDSSKRRVIAGRLEPISAATAQALLSYTHIPDLF